MKFFDAIFQFSPIFLHFSPKILFFHWYKQTSVVNFPNIRRWGENNFSKGGIESSRKLYFCLLFKSDIFSEVRGREGTWATWGTWTRVLEHFTTGRPPRQRFRNGLRSCSTTRFWPTFILRSVAKSLTWLLIFIIKFLNILFNQITLTLTQSLTQINKLFGLKFTHALPFFIFYTFVKLSLIELIICLKNYP